MREEESERGKLIRGKIKKNKKQWDNWRKFYVWVVIVEGCRRRLVKAVKGAAWYWVILAHSVSTLTSLEMMMIFV